MKFSMTSPRVGTRPVARGLKRCWPPLTLLVAPVLLHAQAAIPPSVAQIGFAPATMFSGATSQMTITLGNTNQAAAQLLQVLTDTLPAGLTIANPAGLAGSCAGAAAVAGGRSVSLPTGAAVPPGGCTIQINVTGASAVRNTYYTDSIAAGALQTTLGANAASASGTLTVQAAATVPNLHGLSQQAAANALQAAGLSLGAVTKGATTTATPYAAVSSQTPAAGLVVQPGSAVAINISSGAGLATNVNRPLTSVPQFVQPYQESEAAALERLCAALQSADQASLSAAQRNLGSNCQAIIGTYGGGVDAAGLKQTLDALSGRQTSAQTRTGLQFAGAQFTNLGTRLAQLRQGATGASLSGLDLGLPSGTGLPTLLAAVNAPASAAPSGGGASADTDSIGATTRLGFFVNGSLRRGSQETSTYEAPFDFRSNSVTAGLDYRLTPRFILGVAAGHANGTTNFTDGSGGLDSNSNSASLYATYYNDAFYADLMGSYARLRYSSARTTSFSINPNTTEIPSNCAAGTCSVVATGSTNARQLAANMNVGYTFSDGAWTFGPDVSVDYTHVQVNAFSEADPDGSGLALVFGADSGDSLLGKAGGHLAYAIKMPFGVLLPEARAHYVHEFRNDQHTLSVHFGADPLANAPSGPVSNFVVFTDPPDRGYFDWAAGISAQFAFGISAFVDYNAVSSSYQRVHEFAIGIRIEHQVR